MPEAERVGYVLVKFTSYGQEDEINKIAIELKRRIHLEMTEHAEVYRIQDRTGSRIIKHPITDDYSDDGGEEWHAHDWRSKNGKAKEVLP